jgi:hypothetical protein
MAYNNRRGDDAQTRDEMRDREHGRQQRRQAASTAQQRQAKEMQGLMTPEIIDTLLKAQDLRDGPGSAEMTRHSRRFSTSTRF